MFKMPKNKSPTHIFVKLNTIEDLTRMSCALEKIPFMIFSYKQKQNYMFYVDYHQINQNYQFLKECIADFYLSL